MFLCFVPLVNTATSAQRMRYAVISSLLRSQIRIKGKIKASLRIPVEVVRITLKEIQREENAHVFLCQVSPF